MSVPTSVEGVLARLREIDVALPAEDGVAVFNRMYLTVTARIAGVVADPALDPASFRDEETMAELGVGFANHWLAAFDEDAAGRRVTPAWRAHFELRSEGRLPVQYAVAGMNTHIEHDLPITVVDTCRMRGLEPDDIRTDYETVNRILAEVESPIRRSFLNAVGRRVDDRVGPVVHLISTWNIDKARDLAWVTAETIWALRRTSSVRDRFLDGLGHTVGMTSRALLIPTD